MSAETIDRDPGAEAVRTRIAQRLCGAGVPWVDVRASSEDGADGHGGFAIRTEYGGVKLYLPDDVLHAYAREETARQTVEAAITGVLELLRRP